MKKVKVCLDSKEFNVKPLKEEAALINNRLPNYVIEVNSPNSEKRFAELIGKEGHTFCPATFKNGKRCKENFEQQQYFALDFDNKDPKHILTFDEVRCCKKHNGNCNRGK